MLRDRRVQALARERPDPLEHALALVGPKWTLLILGQLTTGPRRFSELGRALGEVNPKMITARLRELERYGLISRTVYAEVPPRVEYELTERGRGLGPAINALREWGGAASPPRTVGRGRERRRSDRAS